MVQRLLLSLVGGTDLLKASIVRFSRPDLLLSYADAVEEIPLNPSEDYFDVPIVPGVGELMLASFPVTSLGKVISPKNPWWIGEKYDGIRFCLNPEDNRIYSRSGVPLQIPKMIQLPVSQFLDGELWFGRGLFSESLRLIHNPEMINWVLLRMIVFDIPSPSVSNIPYESRFKLLFPHDIIPARQKCASKERLSIALKDMIKEGGEGIILQSPDAPYEHGRSSKLLKLKAARGDKEALVVAALDDELVLRLPDETTFEVAVSDIDLNEDDMPQKGDVVTFSYKGFTPAGVPVDPHILRVREDLEWQHILQAHVQGLSLNGTYAMENSRMALENFANSRNLDPLLAETWYSISLQGLQQLKALFNGSWINTLKHAFPEIKFDREKLMNCNYWKDSDNRRKFFEDFAHEKNFDPLVPDNWYYVRWKELDEFLGFRAVMLYYDNSVSQALVHVFPEIGLQESSFLLNYRKESSYQRKSIEEYAKLNGFDPLTPEAWNIDIPEQEDEYSTMSFYNLELGKAIPKNWFKDLEAPKSSNGSKSPVEVLKNLFPEIGFRRQKFAPRKYWMDPQNRKNYLINFAAQQGFYHTDVSAWDNVSEDYFISKLEANKVLAFHNRSLARALVDLFPDNDWSLSQKITLEAIKRGVRNKSYDKVGKFLDVAAEERKIDETRAKNYPEAVLPKDKFERNHWSDHSNRRIFFENFARDNQFDPLIAENWYPITRKDLRQKKGASSMEIYYTNLPQALASVFPEISLDKTKFVRVRKL